MIQLQALNKILSTKDISIITLNNLDESYFSDFVSEYRFIVDHYNKYNKVPDLETFINKFEDFKLLEVNESNDYILDELYKDKNTRDLAYTFNRVRDLITSGDIDQAMSVFKSASDKIIPNRNITSIDITKDTSRYELYIDKTKDFNKYYVSTGFKELDNLIGGWDRNEELATIIARPGCRKTWTLLKMALSSAQQGLRVGIYSGEMSESKVGYRIDTLLGHISNGALMHGNDDVKLEYKQYIDSLPTLLKGTIKVLTPFLINGPATVSSLRAFIEKENLDILFVDQHSLLDDERKAKTPVEKASNISRDLKILQSLKKIPIICVSQMNRTKGDDDSELITLDQIAQADRIGQDSTIVIGLSKDKNDKNIMKMQIVKTRDTGEVGKTLSYYTNLNVGEYKYIPESSDEQNDVDYEHRYDVEGEDVF